MASKRDMRNLTVRNGVYHFRGYVTKALRESVGKSEIHVSLNTTVYAEAVHKRDAERIRFREFLGGKDQKLRDKFRVVDQLTDDEILDISRQVYSSLWNFAGERREAFLTDNAKGKSTDRDGFRLRADELTENAITGSDPSGNAKDWMEQVLALRMIKLLPTSDSARKLKLKIIEVAKLAQDDLVDMNNGEAGKNANPTFFDHDTQRPRPPRNSTDALNANCLTSALMGPNRPIC